MGALKDDVSIRLIQSTSVSEMCLIYVVYTRLDAKRSTVQGNLLSELKTQKIVCSVVLYTAKKFTNTVQLVF